jgi:arginyl-tRNA synthetase
MKRILTIFALVLTFALQAQTGKVTSESFDVNGFINTQTSQLVNTYKLNKEQAEKLKKWNNVTAYAIQKQLVVAEMDGKTSFSSEDIATITARVKENMSYEAELAKILSKRQYKKYLKAQK